MNILSSMLTFIAEKIGSTTMGTTAETLTGAIAENRADISELSNSINNMGVVAVNVSLGALDVSSSGVAGGTIDISESVPTGYSAIAAIPRNSGGYSMDFITCALIGSTSVYAQLYRRYGTATSVTPSVTLICVKGL